MVAAQKKPKVKSRKGARAYDVLASYDCDVVACDFDIDIDEFDLPRFYQETGLSPKDKRWSGIIYAERAQAGYHIHFDGRMIGKELSLSLKYYGRSVTRPTSRGPFAENAMQWLGSFLKRPKAVCWVHVTFSKPNKTWRSRFNLPFRVTMSGTNAEVVIDGITLDLPHNPFGAEKGWINKFSNKLDVAVLLRRNVTFSKFDIEDELPVYNEAIGTFVEEIK
jgi:hypothetical protein